MHRKRSSVAVVAILLSMVFLPARARTADQEDKINGIVSDLKICLVEKQAGDAVDEGKLKDVLGRLESYQHDYRDHLTTVDLDILGDVRSLLETNKLSRQTEQVDKIISAAQDDVYGRMPSQAGVYLGANGKVYVISYGEQSSDVRIAADKAMLGAQELLERETADVANGEMSSNCSANVSGLLLQQYLRNQFDEKERLYTIQTICVVSPSIRVIQVFQPVFKNLSMDELKEALRNRRPFYEW